jgi:hypothetical protein
MTVLPVVLAAVSIALAQAPTTPPSHQTGRLPALGYLLFKISTGNKLKKNTDGTLGTRTAVVSIVVLSGIHLSL